MRSLPDPTPRPRPGRRFLIVAAALGIVVPWRIAGADRPGDAEARAGAARFADEARIAARREQPLLVFFSLAGCPYCEALRIEQIAHLARDPAASGVRVVELRIDDDRPMPGLDDDLSPRQFARSMGVRVAPTVAFTDGRRALVEPLVGYQGRDFYAAYLEGRIDAARAALVNAPRR